MSSETKPEAALLAGAIVLAAFIVVAGLLFLRFLP
jgi:hypothetical protein